MSSKQRQQQQQDRERPNKQEPESNSSKNNQLLDRPASKNEILRNNSSDFDPTPAKSEFLNLNNLNKADPSQAQSPPQPAPRAKANSYSDFESDSKPKLNHNNSHTNSENQIVQHRLNQEPRDRPLSDQKVTSSRPRVRISSVVENIETREHYAMSRSPPTNDKYYLSDENEDEYDQQLPYELTKPIKLASEPVAAVVPTHQPKIMEKKPFKSELTPKMPVQVGSSSKTSNSSSSENNKSDENISNTPDNVSCFFKNIIY